MASRAPKAAPSLFLLVLLACVTPRLLADARFDLVGPRIDVRVTRGDTTLPIAAVPNLQPGDKLWLHPDLPASQSVHYLLICVFLRGTTNPPPDNWFIRIETWQKKVREEGAFVTVPAEAQQAVLFLAPETGGDFSTLRSAVQGRPGVFVRASQDLAEAGFEQARIEKYLASIRRVPPSDPVALQTHSDLLARTLALKPNPDCFKRPVDTQFTCLTQTGTQTLLDDGHGQSVVAALSSGPGSDFINAASATSLAGGGIYSAYVGAIVDLVRIMSNLHIAQYQYIPAVAFPQQEAMNLRLNTPPSFHNPKSVLVIGLPAVQAATPPPLRPADANHVACLLEPSVVLPIEGAPLVFSTGLAHHLVLHLNTPPGAPAEPDIPLSADAYQGGLILHQSNPHQDGHTDPHTPLPLPEPEESAFAHPELSKGAPANSGEPKHALPAQPEPVTLTGTITGFWGFDAFTGPTISLQQLPGSGWHIVSPQEVATTVSPDGGNNGGTAPAGHPGDIFISSTGSACVHTIAARPVGADADVPVSFKATPRPNQPNLMTLSLSTHTSSKPGDLHLAIQQFDQPKADELSARTFAEPAHITSADVHAGDRFITLHGSNMTEIAKLALGDLQFFPPAPGVNAESAPDGSNLRLQMPDGAPAPPTHADERLTAIITLRDARTLSVPVVIAAARPALTLLRKTITPAADNTLTLSGSEDLALTSSLTFTLKSATTFPRNGQIEIETLDGTLRTVLTLAPSGGLLLQDPHTIVATLDPLRSFGPSAFGPLRLRAAFPQKTSPLPATTPTDPQVHRESDQRNPAGPASAMPTIAVPAEDALTSDWIPLVTLIRLPTLSQLECPADVTQPCVLTGTNLFLIDTISGDPAFSNPTAVPDGYTGTSLSLPRPPTAQIFLHLRDDPAALCSATPSAPALPVKATKK